MADPVPSGAYCNHTGMAEHCPGCGHFSCPCGIEWDDGAEGSFWFDDNEYESYDEEYGGKDECATSGDLGAI